MNRRRIVLAVATVIGLGLVAAGLWTVDPSLALVAVGALILLDLSREHR